MLCWNVVPNIGFMCRMFDRPFIPISAFLLNCQYFLGSGENLPTSFYFHMKIIAGLSK